MNLVQHSSLLQPSLAAVITGETEGVKGTVARQLQVQVRAKGKQEAGGLFNQAARDIATNHSRDVTQFDVNFQSALNKSLKLI